MSEYHVIARIAKPQPPVTDPADILYTVPCPECRQDRSDRLFRWELDHPNTSTVFCGRWHCDALLRVRAT